MKSKKACTLLLYFYVLFCLPSTHLRFVFSSQKPTFRVPTHISRAESTELEEEAKKKERKENNGFYFFLLILIKERKKESQSQGFIYHEEKDKRLLSIVLNQDSASFWFAKIA